MEGTIKFFKEDSGFGFITAASKDYFFHAKDCISQITSEHRDEKVEFEIGENKKGECAKKVKIIYS